MLSALLEAKDRQLLNHWSRVSFYATLLANRTNLTVEEQKSLALGAFLHDIGKVGNETYRFADDEIVATNTSHELRSHPEIGAKMVAPLGLPAATGQIIASHHERWDGTGYPHGLKGEGIPILARIVCLAQTFDHLTAELPDRIALPIDDASSFIAARAGSYFDPQLTALFTQVVQECKASLPAMAIATSPSTRSDV
jgi:putative nucleotidyltransferase with HDIG domain